VWFKITYSLADMRIGRPSPVPETVVDLGEDREVKFWIRTFASGNIRPQLCCDAVMSHAPSDKTLRIFQSLANRVLSEELRSQFSLPHFEGEIEIVDANGNILGSHLPRIKLFPQHFQQQYRSWQQSLTDLVASFVKTLRWVQAPAGSQAPFAQVSFEWSFNKRDWSPMPGNLGIMVTLPRGLDMSTTAIDQVREVWLSGQREPLGHELIREAFDSVTRNPRSALLIAISALEVGVKEYIAFLVQHSDIILEDIQSPPVVTLLQKVIPHLHKALSVNAPEFPLAKDDEDLIKKWVARRNKIAHAGAVAIEPLKLMQFLAFLRSLLYTFDFYRNLPWAQAYTNRDALEEFRLVQ
jgi:hypothetical protein